MRDNISGPTYVNIGQSSQIDTKAAVQEAAATINPAETCFVLVFTPQGHDLGVLAQELETSLAGVPIFGCTTAGQITSKGYESETLLLLAFSKANFRCASVLLSPLNPLCITTIAAIAKRHTQKFQHTAGWNRLGLVISDGISKQEDLLISTLETVLDDLPVFGGSAGDGLAFKKTYVLHKGTFHENAALLLLLETNLQFQGLGFDHFLPAETQLIITDADPEERLVFEINGELAAVEYARLVGCTVDDLSPMIFAENPLLVQHNKNHYVRAINDATDSRGLSFLAAIDNGLVMTLGKGQEILETMDAGLSVVDAQGRPPDFVLGFDCVLRKLEIEQKQLISKASELFRNHRVFGFNTYGEQHCGVHMNQTFVGVAFFEPEERHLF